MAFKLMGENKLSQSTTRHLKQHEIYWTDVVESGDYNEGDKLYISKNGWLTKEPNAKPVGVFVRLEPGNDTGFWFGVEYNDTNNT